ncbi:phospho-sugar mutase [Thermoclostridium caenicola]|uniref:Alpha-phosphoglucomutase n=1 Tax=Thermoclostridium caenicola TaxID=659425 RepID=A0A1M6JK77_9FIRM|nr:phospho-sugar mutase [Thermoclostridium caenicola]SHJ47086.1 alpha-phosphoglucomutase [Thermoclostridium caenicola]HOL84565.1 phospho-sugar mutase [Thermoclostridium caenicola]HPO76456.1 phospho-sugar mutase [Thermoclostridium caenicola]
MNYRENYNYWLSNPYFDEETKKELLDISGNEKEIEDRFYRELEFGTGGMRGLIGAGTNRINRYMVRKAAQGLANTILKRPGEKEKGIVIAHDSRRFSREFALESALVFAANGIKAYLFDSLRPTPELSFAVRHLGCAAGVVITASHNPKEYNGFKAYGSDGGQLPPKESDEVIREVNAITDIASIPIMSEKEARDKGLLCIIGKEVDDAYIEALKKVSVNPEICRQVGKTAKLIYTPLHGTGNVPVMRILKEIGFEQVMVVKEQQDPDPEFSTVKYPNPEEKSAFNLAMEMAAKEDVDLIIGTDPDADRAGIVVRNAQGEYVTLTGNQTGCLLLEYILSQKKQRNELPENAFAATTIVSSDLAERICRHYSVELVTVLTGFKFIGEQIRLLDDTGKKRFMFGFEESYGYLAGTHARDKDAVVASMLIAEMFAWYKSRGMTLYDGLMEIFNKYGYFREDIDTFTLQGKEGAEKIQAAMATLREKMPASFGKSRVTAIRDYQNRIRKDMETGETQALTLPKSNVLYFEMGPDAWFCIRPSGTEPKIKIYYGVSAGSDSDVQEKLAGLKQDVLEVIKPLLD